MSKSNNEVTIETLVKTISEMTATLNTLTDKINYLEKNAQMKPKPQWPIRNTDHCVMNPVIDRSTSVNINSDGSFTVKSGNAKVKEAIRKIHDENPDAITPINSRQIWMEDYDVFQNMHIKSGILLKDWLDDYIEPDKSKWLDNNYTYSYMCGQITDKEKRSKYAEYYTTDGHELKANETRIEHNSELKYSEWKTTDDRIKAYIMRNEDKFSFIKHITDEKNNIVQWIVRTSNNPYELAEDLFDTI